MGKRVDEFLNGRLPCSALEIDLIRLAGELQQQVEALNTALLKAAKEHVALEFPDEQRPEVVAKLEHGAWAMWMGFGTAQQEGK